MTKDEALRMAIEVMERLHQPNGNSVQLAIQACKDALAETQEPFDVVQDSKGNLVPLYTTPPSREWVGLSDRELFNLSQQCNLNHILGLIDYGRAIESKLREKNG